MKLNFSRVAYAVALTVLMAGNSIADQSVYGSSSSPTTDSNPATMPGEYNGGTVVQPGRGNPGAVNPPPPAPQQMPNSNGSVPSTVPPQDGMMGSPPPAPMDGEVMMGPDGLPQDSSTTMASPPPAGKSMAPPAGPMGPQNSPPPGPQSKVKVNNKQVSKR